MCSSATTSSVSWWLFLFPRFAEKIHIWIFVSWLPSGKLTSLWNITVSNGKTPDNYIIHIFISYIKLPEGKLSIILWIRPLETSSPSFFVVWSLPGTRTEGTKGVRSQRCRWYGGRCAVEQASPWVNHGKTMGKWWFSGIWMVILWD